MVRTQTYSWRGAKAILEKKGLLSEINDVINSIETVRAGIHDIIKGLLGAKGWEMEKNLLKGTGYVHDAYKNGVVVEIDMRGSLLDSVHRNFLRAQVLYNLKAIDALVQITEIEREPKFRAMKRDIELFKLVLSLPIYLIGLG